MLCTGITVLTLTHHTQRISLSATDTRLSENRQTSIAVRHHHERLPMPVLALPVSLTCLPTYLLVFAIGDVMDQL